MISHHCATCPIRSWTLGIGVIFVGSPWKIFDGNRDVSSDKLFSNTLATNGLARGYAPRPHKRKRSGLRFAIVVLLLAVAGALYVSQVTEPPAPTSVTPPAKPRLYLEGEDTGRLYLEGEDTGRLYLEPETDGPKRLYLDDFTEPAEEVGKYGPKRLYLLDEDE